MAKSTKLARVVVELEIAEPRLGRRRFSNGVWEEEPISVAWRERAREVEKKIEALVRSDMLDGVDAVSVEGHREDTCSECRSPWTERSETYNGGCCDADAANDPEVAPASPRRPTA